MKKLFAPLPVALNKLLFFVFVLSVPLAAEQTITPEEKQKIDFMFLTLSENSSFALLFKKGELEKAGRSVDHLEPYTFLGYIFSNPKLSKAIPKIAPMVWRRFVRDYGKRLDRAKVNGALNKDATEAFAKKMGLSPEMLDEVVETRNWPQLFNMLLSRKSS